MKTKLRFNLAAASLVLAAFFAPAASAQVTVDLKLALLVDVSGSVNDTEYGLQKNGYVQAFQSAAIQNAIDAGALGRIAVTYIEWSGSLQQSQLVNWTLIDTAAQANAFAASISGTARAFTGGNTAPGSALNFATPLFASSNSLFTSDRWVIDVSGDGAENAGANTFAARAAALAAGVDTINGVVILGEAGLAAFYTNNIVGGTNGFLETATTFQDFGEAIDRKLIREIRQTPVPEPSTYGLIGAAVLMGVVVLRRRNKAAAVA
ncbi:MAG: DUF1194 domain-containing protein [Opitutaceae bacterium]